MESDSLGFFSNILSFSFFTLPAFSYKIISYILSYIYQFLSWTIVLTFDFKAIVAVILLLCSIAYFLVYRFYLTTYSRLPRPPLKPSGASYDLHPDSTYEDPKTLPKNYAEEFLGSFLQSIKVFGYIEQPVFHELAKRLQTRKLPAGDVLFHADGVSDRSFYIVVEGCVQVFVKSGNPDDESQESPDSMPGHHLLTEVQAGGTVSSLFTILSLFTEDVQLRSAVEITPPQDNQLNNLPNGLNTASGTQSSSNSPPIPDHSLDRADSMPSENSSKSTVFPFLDTSSDSDYDHSNSPMYTRSRPFAPSRSSSRPHSLTRGFSVNTSNPPFLNGLTARAAKDTTLVVIPAEAFLRLSEKFPNAAAHIVQVILTRFQRVTFQTLYKYLGLSKELLQIERMVNEYAGAGLPDSFFKPGGLERLRHRFRISNITNTASSHNFRKVSIGNGLNLHSTYIPTPTSPTESFYRRSSENTGSKADLSLFEAFGDPEEDQHLRHQVFDCIVRSIGLQDVFVPRERVSVFSSLLGDAPRTHGRRDSIASDGGRYGFGFSQHRYPNASTNNSQPSSQGGSKFELKSPLSSHAPSSASLTSNVSEFDENDIELKFFDAGSVLIKQGERIPGLYFVIDGILSVTADQKDNHYPSPLQHTSSNVPPRHSDPESAYPEYRRRDDLLSQNSLFFIKPGGLAGYLAALTAYPSFVTVRARTDAVVGFVHKSALDRIVDRHPIILLTLAKRLITQLSPLVLHIDFALEWVQVNAGQVLHRQSDRSDAIYIVLNGRLRNIHEKKTGFEIVGEYGQGESVGEMEVLMDMSRFSTLHAIRDTELAKMPKSLFNALALRHPEITIQISRIIASRSQHQQQQTMLYRPLSFTPSFITSSSDLGKNNVNLKTVAILPVSSIVPIAEFAERLKDAIDLVGDSSILLNQATVMSVLGKHAFSRMGKLKLMSWLAEQEERVRIVLYLADGGVNSVWTQRCIRQADCILLVGLGDEDPAIGEYERYLLAMKTTARKELVLLHNERQCPPGSTQQWLKNRLWIHAHHHVQMPLKSSQVFTIESRKITLTNLRGHLQSFYNRYATPSKPTTAYRGLRSDFARLARRLLGKSIGLVLGGGGARGLAHLGVITALEDAGIPIDVVGGTSIGSLVGGLYARESDHVSIYGRAKSFASRMSSVWRKVLDLTYPVTSYFTGHEFNRGIWKCFHDVQIEDLWLNYFCVTTNVTFSRMDIHQSGYLWRYVRASMSLSGFLPPLCDNGNLLVDGGYLNNLPVDVMKGLGVETIIAVDVGSEDDTSPVHYGDSLSGWWVILNRLNPFRRTAAIPSLAEIQSRLAYVSSVRQLEDAKTLPGVFYLRPSVTKFGTLDFGKFDEIFREGYTYGRNMITSWEKDGSIRLFVGDKQKEVSKKGMSKGRRYSI
ncbi:hypothetical protein BKA69DRAFT_1068943 [Paraphysoderma sedebokerense]|nr:hypothetical protein BKA69DRAFT_1068943 [Paraphysoderma sedebokerense]